MQQAHSAAQLRGTWQLLHCTELYRAQTVQTGQGVVNGAKEIVERLMYAESLSHIKSTKSIPQCISKKMQGCRVQMMLTAVVLAEI